MTTRCPTPDATVAAIGADEATKAGQPAAEHVDHRLPEAMTAQERAAVRRGLADLRAGRIASDDEIDAVFRRFRP